MNRLVEPYLLNYIKETVLTPDVFERLVEDANQHIGHLQSQTPEDLTPLNASLDELRRSRERLIALVADSLAPSLDAVRTKLAAIKQEMSEINRRIQKIREHKASRIAPLTYEGVIGLLDNIKEVLEQDVPNVNEALQQLLGPVPIREVFRPGRKLAIWIAEIQGDLGGLLAHAGRCSKTSDAFNLMNPMLWLLAYPNPAITGYRYIFTATARRHIIGRTFVSPVHSEGRSRNPPLSGSPLCQPRRLLIASLCGHGHASWS